jgi:hypothetical protein
MVNNEFNEKKIIFILDVFVHFYIGNVPYISQSDKIAPLSQPSDGFMDIQVYKLKFENKCL